MDAESFYAAGCIRIFGSVPGTWQEEQVRYYKRIQMVENFDFSIQLRSCEILPTFAAYPESHVCSVSCPNRWVYMLEDVPEHIQPLGVYARDPTRDLRQGPGRGGQSRSARSGLAGG